MCDSELLCYERCSFSHELSLNLAPGHYVALWVSNRYSADTSRLLSL